MSTTVARLEDMSVHGLLRLIQQDDGDIIIAVTPEENGCIGLGVSVEFCTSGGKSPHTLHALRALMAAMQKDNEECQFRKPKP